jgi:hypothetical protein
MVATTTATPTRGLTIQASDISGQKVVTVRDIPLDSTIGLLIDDLVHRMELIGRTDGRPTVYTARLDREGRHLNASERVSDALEPGDKLVLTPDIDAG